MTYIGLVDDILPRIYNMSYRLAELRNLFNYQETKRIYLDEYKQPTIERT